jgi:predicted nucleic acid-binding protein
LNLLDTNVVSELIRRRPNPNVLDWMARQDQSFAITGGCVVEIQRGVALLEKRSLAKAVELQEWLESVLRSDIVFLPMNIATAQLYGRMTAVPELKDLWMPSPKAKNVRMRQDLEMAAFAIVHSATMVTMNVKDFLKIDRYFPLPGLFNPATLQWSILPKARSSSRHDRPIRQGGLYSHHRIGPPWSLRRNLCESPDLTEGVCISRRSPPTSHRGVGGF